MLGSDCCLLDYFLVIPRSFYPLFYFIFFSRPVGLYGARVSVVCALSERGKGFFFEKKISRSLK